MGYFDSILESAKASIVSYAEANWIDLIVYFAIGAIVLALIKTAIKWGAIAIISGLLIFAMFEYTNLKPTWDVLFPQWIVYPWYVKIAVVILLGFCVSNFVRCWFWIGRARKKRASQRYFHDKYVCENDYHGTWNTWTRQCEHVTKLPKL